MHSLSKTNKEASTVLRSVVKHLGSGRALEVGKNTRLHLLFPPYTSFMLHGVSWLLYNRTQHSRGLFGEACKRDFLEQRTTNITRKTFHIQHSVSLQLKTHTNITRKLVSITSSFVLLLFLVYFHKAKNDTNRRVQEIQYLLSEYRFLVITSVLHYFLM